MEIACFVNVRSAAFGGGMKRVCKEKWEDGENGNLMRPISSFYGLIL